jgi:hypothetical protein
MAKLSQIGIAIVFLGVVIAVIGLFPGVIGLEQSPGIGIVQTLVILAGFTTLTMGALLFVQTAYYPGIKHNLAQQIGFRLSLTGLVLAIAAGLADLLGYGSQPPGVEGQRPFLGNWQAFGLLSGFAIASVGVLIVALMGPKDPPDTPNEG